MNLFTNEIITYLKTKSFTYPNVSIVRSFNGASKTFPRIVVRQITDITLNRGTTPTTTEHPNGLRELASGVAFQFEIYTQDCVDNDGNVKSRDAANDEITNTLDDLIFKQYGFNRDDVTEIFKYSEDTVVRYLRYSGAIDFNKNIYRSSNTPYRGYTYQNNY